MSGVSVDHGVLPANDKLDIGNSIDVCRPITMCNYDMILAKGTGRPSSAVVLGIEKFHQLLAVGRWFPPGTPVSSTRKLISSSSFHRLRMTLAVAEALNPNTPNQTIPLPPRYRAFLATQTQN